MAPKPTKSGRQPGPPYRVPWTKSVRKAGKSATAGRGLHPPMAVVHDPEDPTRDRYECSLPFSNGGALALPASVTINENTQMTLCGSEVPQDRWRGRTAGSGMWTLTRDNLLSWSLDDPAITSG